MGGKPRKKPVTFGDLASATDRITLDYNWDANTGSFWEVTRRLGPNNKMQGCRLAITAIQTKEIRRGTHKGRRQVQLTAVYFDEKE